MMANDQDRDDDKRIVAIGLLTHREVTMVGAHLSRLYPIDDDSPFTDLIDAIDEADRQFHQSSSARSC